MLPCICICVYRVYTLCNTLCNAHCNRHCNTPYNRYDMLPYICIYVDRVYTLRNTLQHSATHTATDTTKLLISTWDLAKIWSADMYMLPYMGCHVYFAICTCIYIYRVCTHRNTPQHSATHTATHAATHTATDTATHTALVRSQVRYSSVISCDIPR